MPKIIENLPQILAQEAKKQVLEHGYEAMTIRSVAKKCQVGVGTVYNYYPSKEALVAAFLLEDWKSCIASIESCAQKAEEGTAVLREIHRCLTEYIRRHQAIFRDKAAALSISGTSGYYHGLLRSQLAAPIRPFCKDDFAAEFVAEAMLTWTVAGKDFGSLNEILKQLF